MKDMAKYLYEIGQLKRVKRSGWWMAGIRDPESVAEHSFRVAIIGYMLAGIEGADPMKVATMCLFHDTHEARINDPHLLVKKYVDTDEKLAISEQVERLPQPMMKDVASLMYEYKDRKSLEAQIARDADLLECLIQALEYHSQGYTGVQEWIDNSKARLKSEAAKSLAEACLLVKPYEWWLEEDGE